jgi:hypothetical protein
VRTVRRKLDEWLAAHSDQALVMQPGLAENQAIAAIERLNELAREAIASLPAEPRVFNTRLGESARAPASKRLGTPAAHGLTVAFLRSTAGLAHQWSSSIAETSCRRRVNSGPPAPVENWAT